MKEERKRLLAGLLVALAAAGFLCLGIYRGEAEMIFTKATNICMECIGLG